MSDKRVLVSDAEVEASSRLVQALKAKGYDVSLAKSVRDVLRNLESTPFDFAISELKFTDGDGIDVIAAMKAECPMCRLVLSSRFCDIATAVRAVKAGASDVVPKPVPDDILIALLLDEPLQAQSTYLPDAKMITQECVKNALSLYGENVSRTARALGMHRKTLQRMVNRAPWLLSRALKDGRPVGRNIMLMPLPLSSPASAPSGPQISALRSLTKALDEPGI